MEHRKFSRAFFEMPTMLRRKKKAGQSLLAEARCLFEFAAEVQSSHDLFPKHWCRHAALLVMKRALVTAEPVSRLSKDSLNRRGC